MKSTTDRDVAEDPVYRFLTTLAEDPFEDDAYAADPRQTLVRAGLAEGQLEGEGSAMGPDGVAGGAWAVCQTCSDPGPDPYPEEAQAGGAE